MKIKNIFFVICASIIFVSEMCAMQLVVKRIPRAMHRVHSMYPTVQKRHFGVSIGDIMGGTIDAAVTCAEFGLFFTVFGGCCAVPVIGMAFLYDLCKTPQDLYKTKEILQKHHSSQKNSIKSCSCCICSKCVLRGAKE